MAWGNMVIKEIIEKALAPIGVEYRLNEDKSSIFIRLPSKAFNSMEFVFLIYEKNIVAKFLNYKEVEASLGCFASIHNISHRQGRRRHLYIFLLQGWQRCFAEYCPNKKLNNECALYHITTENSTYFKISIAISCCS